MADEFVEGGESVIESTCWLIIPKRIFNKNYHSPTGCFVFCFWHGLWKNVDVLIFKSWTLRFGAWPCGFQCGSVRVLFCKKHCVFPCPSRFCPSGNYNLFFSWCTSTFWTFISLNSTFSLSFFLSFQLLASTTSTNSASD